ncbi:MAG: SRPBCC family protein [Actinomycetota bacterium]
MLIENSFEVPEGVERVWAYLLDVEKVVVCMPGAELTETIDGTNWKGKVKIKLGPVSLSFAGTVTLAERDDDAHRVVLKGSGMEQRGKGRAAVTITTTVAPSAGGTRVEVVQDLQVQGQVASMSRGMMKDVSSKLTKQFADCLEANLRADQETEPAAAAAPSRAGSAAPSPAGSAAEPSPEPPSSGSPLVARGGEVKGFSLMMSALVAALRRFVRRLLGRSSPGG